MGEGFSPNFCIFGQEANFQTIFRQGQLLRPPSFHDATDDIQFAAASMFLSMPCYCICHPSVCPPGVTLMDCDHISWATSNVITRLISPVSQLFPHTTAVI